MFLGRTGFKALIKGAYKDGGLHVVNTGDGWQLFGIGFNLWIEKGQIPKESLGDLIALIGELPAEGEAFSATKEGIQYEMQISIPPTAREQFKSCSVTMEPTRALFVSKDVVRILQNDDWVATIAIAEGHYQIIKAGAIDGDTEELPKGPRVKPKDYDSGEFDKSAGICWANNIMAVSFYYGDTSQVKNEIAALDKMHIMRTSEEV